jgi:predicted site-specific integrase-resolvase
MTTADKRRATRLLLSGPGPTRKKANGCEVLVLNQERLSPEREMVQDLRTIVHCFSSRLYGLRNYRKKLDEALKQEASHE